MATISNPASPSNRLAEDPERIVPVYVWELPVRLVHWGLVIIAGGAHHHRFLHARSLSGCAWLARLGDGLDALYS